VDHVQRCLHVTGIQHLTLSLNLKNLFDAKAPYDPRYPNEGSNTQLHNGIGRYIRVTPNYKY
jgi:iron complex outermembrane receptor protein